MSADIKTHAKTIVTVTDEEGVVLDSYRIQVPAAGPPDASTARAAIKSLANLIDWGVTAHGDDEDGDVPALDDDRPCACGKGHTASEHGYDPDGPDDVDSDEPKYPAVTVQLTGEDSNSFFMVSRARRALERAGVDPAECEAFFAEALKGDPEHVLTTIQAWVNVK